jgi:hypothetical protein
VEAVEPIRAQSPGKPKKEKPYVANLSPTKTQPGEDKVAVMLSSKKGVDVWLEEVATLTDKLIVLPGFECPFYDLNKLKLIFTDIGDRCFKLKLTRKSDEFIFGASNQKTHRDVPTVFYIFAKVISAKLSMMGRKTLGLLELSSVGVP